MRLMVLAALGCLAAGTPVCLSAEFPFTGYISVREAEVASGPGRRFYTTDKLSRGTQVEVYREDDAGWLAIRPPEGSFSWVPAEHIEPQGDRLGKVVSTSESWIGTTIEDVKEHKSQVSLKVGELIEIIERKKVKTLDGEAAWLKIAPPAGEFRFVHSRDVSREPVEDEPATVEASEIADTPAPDHATEESDPQEPLPFQTAASAIALGDIDEVRSRLSAMRKDLAELAPAGSAHHGVPQGGHEVHQAQFKANVATSSSLSPDGFVPRKRRASESLGPVPVPNPYHAEASTPSFTRPTHDAGPHVAHARLFASSGNSPVGSNTPLTAGGRRARGAIGELDQLELDLSLMVAQDKSTWNLAAICARVEQLIERGGSPADRGQARLLLDRIKQFEDAFAVADQGPLGPATLAAAEAPAGSPYAPRYDAKGWLKPVVSRNKPAAPYAVVDQDGKPICFVTPSPGLNIARYANKEVGLFGKRGYIEELKTTHVVAERVIDLERHVR